MTCLLCNGDGSIGDRGGGEGVSITNRLLLGGRLRNTICAGVKLGWGGGGVCVWGGGAGGEGKAGGRQRNDRFTKNIIQPPQLINNDCPLIRKMNYVIVPI